jgi:hypothetical protein
MSDIDVMMIQCDQCNVWQHGPCMGIWDDEEAPDGESSLPLSCLPVADCPPYLVTGLLPKSFLDERSR